MFIAEVPHRTGHDRLLRRFDVHGHGVEISMAAPDLRREVDDLLGDFQTLHAPGPAIHGRLLRYDPATVRRCLSAKAVRVTGAGEALELYQEDERFWIIDDRWGLCELNLLKGQWRSWLLPQFLGVASHEVAEMAVLWPMAQLLRNRGLTLLPAVSIARAGWAGLLISPYGIEAELSTLIHAGYRVIGQRWTAIRQHDDQFDLLRMPGRVERTGSPASPRFGWATAGRSVQHYRVDLTAENLGASLSHSHCDAVMAVAPGRRPRADVRAIPRAMAAGALRAAWPMHELHPQRHSGQLPLRLARAVACSQLQLSRNPCEILKVLERVQSSGNEPLVRLPQVCDTPLRRAAG